MMDSVEYAMKVAVSSSGNEMTSTLNRRFGKAPYFLIVDTKTGLPLVFDNSRNVDLDFGAGGRTAEGLIKSGINAVITGRMCHATFETLKKNDVAVYLAGAGTVEELIGRLQSGGLLPVDSVNRNP